MLLCWLPAQVCRLELSKAFKLSCLPERVRFQSLVGILADKPDISMLSKYSAMPSLNQYDGGPN